MNKSKTLILFDVGGVLLRLDYGSFYKKAAEFSGETAEEFGSRYNESKLEYYALIGKVSASQYIEKLRKLIGNNDLSDDGIRGVVSYCWPSQITENIELKRKLFQVGYNVGILSNIYDLALEIIAGKFPEVFETYETDAPRIYSFEVGAIKPNLDIYRFFDMYENVIFIDDKISYIEPGISNFGWNGILFTPFIDNSESIRNIHRENIGQKNIGILVANSPEELKSRLCGLDITIK